MPNLDSYIDKVLESIRENSKQPECVVRYDLKNILNDVYNDGYNYGYEDGLDDGSCDD